MFKRKRKCDYKFNIKFKLKMEDISANMTDSANEEIDGKTTQLNDQFVKMCQK